MWNTTLTDMGKSLKPVIDAMWHWGEAYQAKAQQKGTRTSAEDGDAGKDDTSPRKPCYIANG